MDRVFDAVVDRTRSRLDVPKVRTVFGAYARPHRDRIASSPIEAVIETPAYDLTIFKLHVGRLTAKAYTKGERVLRFETIAHNTAELRFGRTLDKFPDIVTRLAGMAERFCTMLDCVDIGFIPDLFLDQLPAASQIGATRVGDIDLHKPRIRTALNAVLALAAAPAGFTVTDLTTKVHAITGRSDYTTRQAAYDLRKLRGKDLIDKPTRARRYHVPPQATRTIAALLALRDHVIAPIIAGVRSPQLGRKPAAWTAVDRDLRTVAHPHPDPLPRPWHHHSHHHNADGCIDNELSIRGAQAPRPVPGRRRAGGAPSGQLGWAVLFPYRRWVADDLFSERYADSAGRRL
jgi:hypothetical protein